MVVGLGVDLVEMARVERLLARYGGRLLRRLMDPDEADRLPAPGPERVRAVSLAIAGKEAASKALGTGWSRGVRWRDIVVAREPEPEVRLRGRAADVARERGSSGRTRTRLAIDGSLAIGEVWLLR
ncbi:MAG: holo-ACP synthase [Acidobacteria bacterium]|jgi:holo-[acyl-carrier protein] synthase|nr:holo-ACP synthase [Acidobacteriota bacterium]